MRLKNQNLNEDGTYRLKFVREEEQKKEKKKKAKKGEK